MSKWEKEIDSILASVDEAMLQAEALSKSYKNEDDKDDKKKQHSEMKKEASSESEEPQEASSESEEPQETEAPPSLEQESEEGPVSDDELKEIYGTMEPEDLQRHFMIIREILRSSTEQNPSPPPQEPSAPEENKAQPMAMSEKESIIKSEFNTLKAKNEELEKALGRLTAVMENTFLKPSRKAITDIAYIQKSENSFDDEKQLTKSELRSLCNEKCKDRSLSKSDREALNDYLLNGGSSDKVTRIVKGGK